MRVRAVHVHAMGVPAPWRGLWLWLWLLLGRCASIGLLLLLLLLLCQPGLVWVESTLQLCLLFVLGVAAAPACAGVRMHTRGAPRGAAATWREPPRRASGPDLTVSCMM
jgi:hypothetical protein